MCLIVFAWQVVQSAPLIAAANRDELYDRPTAPAQWWQEHPKVFAGRDMVAGGAWIGITRDGPGGPKFAALTNVREGAAPRPGAPSRGHLVADYLSGDADPQQFVDGLSDRSGDYKGFNLLLGDRNTLIWFSNRGQTETRNGRPLPPGIYGLSNALLDPPWPKVVRTKAQFASLMCQGAPEEAYFEMLADTARAPDVRLPDTGITLELERSYSSVYIETPAFGTRSSTVVKLYADAPAVLREQFIK